MLLTLWLFFSNDIVFIVDFKILMVCSYFTYVNNTYFISFNLFLYNCLCKTLDELESSITNMMQLAKKPFVMSLCLDVLNKGVDKEDINSYLNFMIDDNFKQSNECEGMFTLCFHSLFHLLLTISYDIYRVSNWYWSTV